MKEIIDITDIALERYFNNLSLFGYYKYSEVNKLLVLLFINDFLLGEASFFVTEEDYKKITNALYCLYGSNCILDFPSYNTIDSLFHNTKRDFSFRITEDSIFRNTEDSIMRIEA